MKKALGFLHALPPVFPAATQWGLAYPCKARACVWLCAAWVLCVLEQGAAQGTINITFDAPPVVPRGSAIVFQQYFERGIMFTPIDPNAPFSGFVRRGGGGLPFYPENGTAYIQADASGGIKFSSLDGVPFDLLAVDLAEYSTVVPDAVTVHFVGYRQDSSIVTTDLITDGIIDGTGPLQDFQTFNFQGFTGLSRVEIPTHGWSLDNLVVSIPEPGTWAVLLTGGMLLCASRRRSK